jgi:DNA-binding MurR/RpiR family transcriptional regulator
MKPLDERILDSYEDMTPLEQRLAGVLLEHQRDLASYSATELASQAGVSKATAARLFKRLGYRSYADARRQSRSLHRWGSPLSRLDAADRGAGDPTSPIAHLHLEAANLTRSFEATDAATFAAALTALADAGRVWLIAFRASRPLAELAAFWLKYLRKSVTVLPTAGLTFAEDAVDMQPGDLVFAIGLRRRPRVFRAFLQNARDLGVTVLLLTDLTASATARLGDVVIRCHSRSLNAFDSYTAAASMVNYLLGRLATEHADQVRPRLERIEELADRLDTFTVPTRVAAKRQTRAQPAAGRRAGG